MNKVAIVLLAGTEGKEAMGRMANALVAVKEFKDAGDTVQLVLDGAGVAWVGELAKSGHMYHSLYRELRGEITGVCHYCAKAFQVTAAIEAENLPFATEHDGHPSFRRLIQEGYQVLTF